MLLTPTIPRSVADDTRHGDGLVISAITGRVSGFPSPELVGAAAAWFPARESWAGQEGPRPALSVAPGVVSISWPDLARRERTAERLITANQRRRDLVGKFIATEGRLPADAVPSRVIEGWSAKSRSRMVRTLAELDYGPLLRMGLRLPMTTLTYPGEWLTVAPDGPTVKRHLQALWRRFERAWGFPWVGIWKLEFQRRGAPHIHLWGPEPVGLAGSVAAAVKVRRRSSVGEGLNYRAWLSVTWAAIVAHPDPDERRRHQLAGTAVDFAEGARLTDPRRLAVYFTKHGGWAAKEYQNCVPVQWREAGAGPGRFWGYRGLEKATAAVELSPRLAVIAARTLRRYARSQGVTRRVEVVRQSVDRRTGEVTTGRRSVRRRVVRMPGRAGFLCVNDGPSLAVHLARVLIDQGDVPDSVSGARSRDLRRAHLPLARPAAVLDAGSPALCDRCGVVLAPVLVSSGARRHLGCMSDAEFSVSELVSARDDAAAGASAGGVGRLPTGEPLTYGPGARARSRDGETGLGGGRFPL